MSNNEILIDIISKILLVDEEQITNRLSRNDLEEWDSMSHLVLISECENEFNISFSDDDVVEIETIADLKDSLLKNGIILN
ncbi:MAG: acyl carrier protein [Candidatus Kariarchaeaceae archaeon]|jgi:acyl carrier protein